MAEEPKEAVSTSMWGVIGAYSTKYGPWVFGLVVVCVLWYVVVRPAQKDIRDEMVVRLDRLEAKIDALGVKH